MCGIAGKVDFDGMVDRDLIESMCRVITHRGPDDEGTFIGDGVGLGMRRLAIIDVANGQQPIFNEDDSVVVVMNGEIYNFQELRDQLISKGHNFRTRVDTEVLVHLYEEHGSAMTEHLRGMFAFALWDRRRRRLILARDRVGKKPLFWARKGNKVWFASELSSLLVDPEIERRVNFPAISAYLTFGYVPHPMSAFDGIEKLPPATVLTIDASGKESRRYWKLDYTQKFQGVSEVELRERLMDELREAVKLRMLSEVPLGAFLSGGIDSSAVVGLMAEQSADPVKTFSIGFPDDDFDERVYAREVAQRFSTDHQEFVVEPHALEILPTLARHYGEPFADSSAIPSFYLAQMTSEHVTVALNGDGGDESLAGYRRYVADRRVKLVQALPAPLRKALPELLHPLAKRSGERGFFARGYRLSEMTKGGLDNLYIRGLSAFFPEDRQRRYQPDFVEKINDFAPESILRAAWASAGSVDRIDHMLATDIETYLPDDLLVKMDIASMAFSVEARSPMLDHRFMEFAASLPPELKLDGTRGKKLLVDALRGFVPDSVLDRKKMGFGVPLIHWFRGELKDLPADLLLPDDAAVHAYIRPQAIREMIDEHVSGKGEHSLRLWTLIQLEMWHREVFSAKVA